MPYFNDPTSHGFTLQGMASIVPGFEYDIFISYRHNDNRSGWVKEFVHHLREELIATLKEPVTIYFDGNLNDGLLETHLVDDSVRDKLKCLIFIPIISQTYTDEKCFAWQNEFLVFKRQACDDAVGLKVKLANGNTTSRILPIKIHDLDSEDNTLLENELGGVLRSIDFIFKSPGVNRPLSASEEHCHDNLNKTFYRDQVNKVANCIKEIISSLKGGAKPESALPHIRLNPVIRPPVRRKLALIAGTALTLLVLSILLYHFILKPAPESMDRSIAVLPFEDMSPNHDQEYFSDGISEEIINALVKIDGLEVPSRTSSFWFKGKSMDLKQIGEKLNVGLILEGSVRKSGDNLRITAQLINAQNGLHLWSETYNHSAKDIFRAQDEVSHDIIKQLQKRLGGIRSPGERKLPTRNLEAYDLYLKGHREFLLKGEHVIKAQEYLKEAIRLDPNFANAHAALAEAYAVYDMGFGNTAEALNSANRALALDSGISSAFSVIAWTNALELHRRGTISPLVNSNFEKAIRLDPQNSTAHLWYGITLMHAGLFERAIKLLRSAMEIDPLVPISRGILGYTEYQYGMDSIGYVHLSESINLGWRAGNQRLAFYFLDHKDWQNAEYYFKEHAKLVPMNVQLDYHELVRAVQKKDIAGVRKIMDSIVDLKGFVAGFKGRTYYLVGDYDRAITQFDDSGLVEAMRPSRRELREHPGFKKYIEENGLLPLWQKYGWPDVCVPVGEDDFRCN